VGRIVSAPRPALDTELTKRLAEALPESLGPAGLRRAAIPALGYEGEITGYGEMLLAALLPVVQAYADQRAADEIERLADERTWITEHDNEVISTRDLYEQVARLRGGLEPVTYDFPPDDAAALRTDTDRRSEI
jgi:hypothetical protein